MALAALSIDWPGGFMRWIELNRRCTAKVMAVSALISPCLAQWISCSDTDVAMSSGELALRANVTE
ncbi:hypothetical protein OUZ56_001637 [Daphnia magna]|uniref:Uncharacterized protein n=1 Tax=Daphnia magna TaxID=35525 RepID=A0ABR0A392_9CRUS|nr:hypothetical protein OUZ56_001637 [Daphnia magna]